MGVGNREVVLHNSGVVGRVGVWGNKGKAGEANRRQVYGEGGTAEHKGAVGVGRGYVCGVGQ